MRVASAAVPIPVFERKAAPDAGFVSGAVGSSAAKPSRHTPVSGAPAMRKRKHDSAGRDDKRVVSATPARDAADVWSLVDSMLDDVCACLSESRMDAVVSAFFDACSISGAATVVPRYVECVRHAGSGDQKLILLNIYTAAWVRCWGRKWAPPQHAEVDAALRANLLRALEYGLVREGPSANSDAVDSLICSWNYLELMDDSYLTRLREALFKICPAKAAQ